MAYKYKVVYNDKSGNVRRWSEHRLKARARESLKEAKIYQPSARIITGDIPRNTQSNNNPFGFNLGGF